MMDGPEVPEAVLEEYGLADGGGGRRSAPIEGWTEQDGNENTDERRQLEGLNF